MLKYTDLDAEQIALVNRIYEFDETIVYATMGSGKTVCYLTAIHELLQIRELNRVLIVAPLNPCKHVWSKEASKWEHLQSLDVALAVGSVSDREKAINSGAPVVVINIENLVWFITKYGKKHGFDAICIDELSKFGDSGNKSVKKMRSMVKTFKHRVGLTGTPVHEGFEKLYSQVLMIDGGERLGTNKTNFLCKYFYSTDYAQYNWELRAGSQDKILSLLTDLIFAMKDYTHTLPPLIEKHIDVELSDEAKADYNKLAKTGILTIPNGDEIIAENAAVLSGKLEQLANGFLYDESRQSHFLHSHKVGALNNFLHSWDGKPILIFYQYQSDKDMIASTLDSLDIDYATLDSRLGMAAFLANKVPVLLLHPKSAGHGLNLHTGGACQILCYTPIWSNDQFKQLVGRLWRRGQANTVTVTSIVAKGTVDDIKINRLLDKAEYDNAFKNFLKNLVK